MSRVVRLEHNTEYISAAIARREGAPSQDQFVSFISPEQIWMLRVMIQVDWRYFTSPIEGGITMQRGYSSLHVLYNLVVTLLEEAWFAAHPLTRIVVDTDKRRTRLKDCEQNGRFVRSLLR